ncbi:MAG: hypothetical protein K1X55_09475 [Chitinophagales bacterium]|nr:hypothetical protein [Chitinophagales bacterium]
MKSFCSLLVFFYTTVLCAQVRYVDDLPGTVVGTNVPYIEMNLKNYWNGGNKPSNNQLMKGDDPYLYNPSPFGFLVPGSRPNNKCFNYHEFSATNSTYNITDTAFLLNFRIFSIEGDPDPCKKAIIFIGGATGFFDNPITGSGLRYFEELSSLNDEGKFGTKTQDFALCSYLAQKGFAVIYIDFRKGWDIKGISNLQDLQGFSNYWYHQYCDCEGNCDPYSNQEASYRAVQDLLTLHAYLKDHWDTLNINPNEISYMGSSSGSNIAMLAAFGRNNFPEVLTTAGVDGTGNMIQLKEKLGNLNVYAPTHHLQDLKIDKLYLLSAAIRDTNWIERADSIYFRDNKKFPVYILQASEDIVSLECGGFGRGGIKYQGILDSSFYNFGGGNIHDRILNLGFISRLISLRGFPHGGANVPIGNFKCYHPDYSPNCFFQGDPLTNYYVRANFTFKYLLETGDNFIHTAVLAEKEQDQVNNSQCNLCFYRLVADKDSARNKWYSCCTQDCDAIFGTAYFKVAEATAEIPKIFEDILVYPNIARNDVLVTLPEELSDKYLDVEITDYLGRSIRIGNFSPNKYLACNIADCPNGLLWMLFKENGQLVGRVAFVKNN